MASFWERLGTGLARGAANATTQGGFMEGRQQAIQNDENKLNRLLREADARRSATQYGEEHYKKPLFDTNGFFTNYESNTESRNRDLPIIKKKLPEYFSNEIDKGSLTDPSVSPEGEVGRFNSSGKWFTTPDAPGGAPGAVNIPQQPPRILRSREERQADLEQKKTAMAMASQPRESASSTPGALDKAAREEAAKAANPGKNVVFADKTDINGGPGLDISGSIATPPKTEEYNPSDYLFSRLSQVATSPEKAKEQDIDVSSLPPKLRERLELQGFNGKLPKSILDRMISVGGKGTERQFDPEVYNAADLVQKGTPVGSVLRSLSASIGRSPSKEEVAFITGLAKSQGVDERADKTRAEQSKRWVANFISKAKSDLNRDLKPAIEGYQSASTILNLIDKPNSAGFKRAMQTMLARSSGEKGALSNDDVAGYGGNEGWWERFEQFKTSARGEGFTPENKEIFRGLANEYMRALEGKIRDTVENAVDSNDVILSSFDVPRETLIKALSIDNITGGIKSRTPSAPKPKATDRRGLLEVYNKRLADFAKESEGMNPALKRQTLQNLENDYKQKLAELEGGK